jgi:hypothetical protein
MSAPAAPVSLGEEGIMLTGTDPQCQCIHHLPVFVVHGAEHEPGSLTCQENPQVNRSKQRAPPGSSGH